MGRRIVVEKPNNRSNIADKPPSFFAKVNGVTQIPESANVIVRNLSFRMDVETLEQVFGSCGTIRKCRIINDAEGNSRGFGFVDFESVESARQALKKDGEKYQGRQINV